MSKQQSDNIKFLCSFDEETYLKNKKKILELIVRMCMCEMWKMK
jgi:hypothetical protein